MKTFAAWCTSHETALACAEVDIARVSARLEAERQCPTPAAAEAEAALAPPAVVVQCDGPFRHEQRWRGTGLAVPVFALRTRNSVGVGEFADIEQLADFCSAAGVWL